MINEIAVLVNGTAVDSTTVDAKGGVITCSLTGVIRFQDDDGYEHLIGSVLDDPIDIADNYFDIVGA